jgi:linoleoyl-CoA desaturase
LAQAAKAKFLEAGSFHQALKARVEQYFQLLYGLLAVKWQFVDDFKDVLGGKVGQQKMPRPTGWKLLGVLGGKLFFFGWALVVPALFHPGWTVALCFALTSFVLGFTLASVFQLAHCVEEASFPELGGLNFQVVHHLFPRVCHLHYPALSLIIEETCREHGVRYRVQESVRAAVGSHVRWLKQMGRPEVEEGVS